MKRYEKIGIIIAFIFILIGILLRIFMGVEWCNKWMLDIIFIVAGVSYFLDVIINKYYNKKKAKSKL